MVDCGVSVTFSLVRIAGSYILPNIVSVKGITVGGKITFIAVPCVNC